MNREGARQEGQDGTDRYLPLFLLCAYLLLGARFFGLIRQYAVNVFFADQWDIDNPTLFQHLSIWEAFHWQHGWHRQGLGALLQKLIEPWIHWNSRYEAFFLGAVMVTVAVLALLLKVRLYGSIRYSDVIIPLLFLTPLQYEPLVFAANPSCILPLLLAILYCLCWLIRAYRWKYICLMLVNFLLIYTGFGIFIGPVTPVLLALDYYENARHLAPKYRWTSAAVLTISIAVFASFFIAYRFSPGVDCFSPAPKNPIMYLRFVALMFANAAGVKTSNLVLATLIGSIALLLLLVSLPVVVKRLLVRGADTWSRDAAIGTLLSYCAVFCLTAAYARLCLGIVAADASRYTPYVVLGLFALYLYALSHRSRNLRVPMILVLLVLAVLGSFPLNRIDAWSLEYISNGKREWRECYLARHDINECDTLTHFEIHPSPEANRLQEKLDLLERNHLNLYDNAQ